MFDITMLMTVLAPIGGIESALVPLARELQAQGHRVRIYVVRRPTLPNQNVASLTAAGIPILSAPPWLVRLIDLVRGRRLALIAAGLTLLSPLLALRQFELFHRIAEETGSLIATGHHKDDQVETVLLHILRGTGVQGLAGMQPDGPILRPLLCVTKEEILHFLEQEGIPWVLDESNLETGYFIANE